MANGVTEFCCRSGGSNLNAGTLVGDSTEPGTSPSFIYESGNWDSSTGEFVVASGNPSSDGVAVTQYASVYVSGTGVTGFVGQVSAVSTTGITIDLADHYAGTAPSTSSGDRSLRIGGAWQGPNGAEGFPLDFVGDLMASGADTNVRVNLKNDQTYAITAAIAAPTDDYRVFQGYQTTYADKNKAEIQGPATGTSFILLNIQGTNSTGNWGKDLHFNQNGDAAGADWGVQFSCGNQRNGMVRCRFSNMYRDGLLFNDSDVTLVDCEVDNNGRYGIHNSAGDNIKAHNCYIHDNTSVGWYTANSQNRYVSMWNCIFANNGGVGAQLQQDSGSHLHNCIFYKNTGDGLTLSLVAEGSFIQDCAFFDNGGYGIDWAQTSSGANNLFRNNAFGTGTLANGAGKYRTATQPNGEVEGDIEEAADFNPWTDPDNGDFTLKSDSLLIRAGYEFPQAALSSTTRNKTIGPTGPAAGGGGGTGASSYSFFS